MYETGQAIRLFRKKEKKAFQIFEEAFRKDSSTFLQELSNALDTQKLRFDECSVIAATFHRLGKTAISIEIYKFLVSKEENFERQIEKQDNPEVKKKLMALKDRMVFSLGRDYNDLGITYVEIGDKDKAKDMILKAYNEDVKHQKWHQAALMPAYRNLSLILIWEAKIFYDKKEFFPSFLMAWISIELNLMRMWFKTLVERSYSNTKMKWLGRLDIGIIVETLYLIGKLTIEEKNDIDSLRGRRNDIIHATGATPTEGEITRVMNLAFLLHSKELA
ncbi:hypothetical protein KAU55_00810 [Candidatus Bathyarchaeota archaeon]|nr:hypothetical protein [Candidatus Bathyarchaeota archaeon]